MEAISEGIIAALLGKDSFKRTGEEQENLQYTLYHLVNK